MKILKKSYEIMIHEIKIKNVNTKKQKEAIEKLLKQNEIFHKNLNITRIFWLKSVRKLEKAILLLIVETELSKKFNRIIFEKFLKESSRKNAMMFVKECKMIQCFNCYEYEHIDKKCKNVMKCDHCAKKHEMNKCSKNEVKIIHKCINCKQTKY